MATINLGRIKPVFRGAYAGGTAYVVDDIVTHGNETFICIQAGTGNATSNASYWTKLAAKGTDGTDVGTTLTTQGDMLYRDGSGLQRLAKGTAAQVLKMNTAANAPEWGSLSSDYVFLGSGSGSSAASISVDLFSADYDIYKIFVTGWYGSANGYNTRMRFNSSANTAASNAVHRFIFTGGYVNSSSTVSSNQGTGDWDAAYFNLSNISSNDYEFADHEITVFRPYSSSTKTSCIVTGGGFEGNHIYSRQGHGIFNTNMQHTGVTFYASSGTVTIPYIKVYGLKTS